MPVLKSIDVMSAAKMGAVTYAIFGIIIAVFIFLFAGAFSSVLGILSPRFLGLGAAILIVIPVVMLVLGFAAIGIESWVYNIIAGRFGGIGIDINNNTLRHVDVESAAKIAAVGGAILGFIFGIAFVIIGGISGSGLFAFFGVISIVLFTIFLVVVAIIVVAIEVTVYNFLAAHIGGFKIYFEGSKLRRVGVLPYAKIEGVFGAIGGVFEGILVALRASSYLATGPSWLQSIGVLSIIVFPIIYFIVGFVFAVIIAALYNWLSPRIGAVKFMIS